MKIMAGFRLARWETLRRLDMGEQRQHIGGTPQAGQQSCPRAS
ncbi:hypothetical protein [Mycobacterium sp. E1747]|nr:hypothetical protein [Mycobacterium sp. E1747]